MEAASSSSCMRTHLVSSFSSWPSSPELCPHSSAGPSWCPAALQGPSGETHLQQSRRVSLYLFVFGSAGAICWLEIKLQYSLTTQQQHQGCNNPIATILRLYIMALVVYCTLKRCMPTSRKSCWNALLSVVGPFFDFFFRFATDSSMLEEQISLSNMFLPSGNELNHPLNQYNYIHESGCNILTRRKERMKPDHRGYTLLSYLSQACLCSGLKGLLLWTCFGWLSRTWAYWTRWYIHMVPSAVTPSARFWLTGAPSDESSFRGRWCMDRRSLDGGETENQWCSKTPEHPFGLWTKQESTRDVRFVFLSWFARAVFLKMWAVQFPDSRSVESVTD